MSHSNISIFVPHLGCPHQCSFCNQKHITGQSKQPCANDVDDAVKTAMSSKKYDAQSCEIAFFGGSFTAIEKDIMVELLSAAHKHIVDKSVSGIRISTRPDCINPDILLLLKKYGVTAIELGAQSMCDDVLCANNRGHLSDDVIYASRLIKESGFELGLQMMTGLYKSDDEKDIFTAKQIISLMPDTVRIYPTITLKNTCLEEMYNKGEYKPQNLESAVRLTVLLEDMFKSSDIKVIRVGLHSIEEDSYIAGPWHPSFHELCESYRFRLKLQEVINSPGKYEVLVNPSDVSKFTGNKRSNIAYFSNKNIKIMIIPDKSIDKNKFCIKEVK